MKMLGQLEEKVQSGIGENLKTQEEKLN